MKGSAATREEQAVVWNYFKPRHTHAWNMLVLSWRQLEDMGEVSEKGFECEYHWENFILRLWLYRNAVNTLVKFPAIEIEANAAINDFDLAFTKDAKNQLYHIRNMIEHFDERAANDWRGGFGSRTGELDPWRSFNRDQYERGQFSFERAIAYAAADKLRTDAKRVSAKFIVWYNSDQT